MDEEQGGTNGSERRKRRHRRKRKNHKRERLYYNLRWLAGGLALGLPLLAGLLYVASHG